MPLALPHCARTSSQFTWHERTSRPFGIICRNLHANHLITVFGTGTAGAMEVARTATGTGVTGVYNTGAEAVAETVAFFCHAYNLWDSCAGQEMSQPSLNKWIKHILCAFFLRNAQKNGIYND